MKGTKISPSAVSVICREILNAIGANFERKARGDHVIRQQIKVYSDWPWTIPLLYVNGAFVEGPISYSWMYQGANWRVKIILVAAASCPWVFVCPCLS